jgi:PAS domain S-box-containing protein
VTRTRTSQPEVIWLWVALGILAAVATLAYRSIDAASETLGRVEHTNQVLRQLREMSGAYSRATSARRAYVVAGDDSQLDDAHDLDARMAKAVASVRASIADNPDQIQRLDSLARLQGQRIADLEGSVARRREGGVGAESADQIALTEHIRTIREEMEEVENKLLADRDARTRDGIENTKLAVVVGTVASIAILLFAFSRLRREIGLRRQSEQALRASEGFLGSIVENLPDMVFVKDARELRFERFNRAGEDLLGVSRKELVGKNDFDFFPRDQAEAFQARDRETLANRVVIDIAEEPIQTARGERWLHTKKVPVLDEHGTPKFLLGISEDITERRKDAAVLKAAKEAAEAANKELESFSYSVAHDLRAPLRGIDGFSQAIEEDCAGQLDETGKAHLTRVRAATKQMAQLIDGLLSLSRVTRGELVREKIDLTRIARQSAARLRDVNPGRQIEEIVQDGLAAEGDVRLISAVFDNLLGNAWKFTSKRATARVEVGKQTENGQAVFFVRDNGAGFDPTYAGKLFGAFQRLHAVSEFDGSGIGLATVQRIVRRHGGRVWAEGEVGRGATFYFTL